MFTCNVDYGEKQLDSYNAYDLPPRLVESMKQAIDSDLMDNKYKVQSNEFVRTLEKESFVAYDQVKPHKLILRKKKIHLFYFKSQYISIHLLI